MKRNYSHPRRGIVLVCVIACLAVSTVLIALGIQSALRSRREVRLHLQLRQTELLCEAGVLRATQKLRDNVAYTGEQWSPPLAADSYHSPSVLIEVTAAPADSNAGTETNATISVTAKLDSHLDHDGPMQRSRQFIWQALEPNKPATPTDTAEPTNSIESSSSTLTETK